MHSTDWQFRGFTIEMSLAQPKSKPVTIGQKLLHKRSSMGASQAKIGIMLGIGQPLVSAIEQGRKTPSGDMLDKITAFVNARPASLRKDASNPDISLVPSPAKETPMEKALRLRNEMLELIAEISPLISNASLDAADERVRECYFWIREYLERGQN
jgi:transcriptional regulator with XRE-family HTH domain